jgi:hypothetical protein
MRYKICWEIGITRNLYNYVEEITVTTRLELLYLALGIIS